MSNKPTLRFLQMNDLGKAGTLELILDTVHKLGMKITDIRVGWGETQSAKWLEYNEQVVNELDIAYEHKQLDFFAMDDRMSELNYLALWFHFKWDYSSNGNPMKTKFYADEGSSQLFTLKEFDREYYAQRLLSIGERLYPILHPEFGWVERCPSRGYTKEKDVKSLSVPHIYWANFFGPKYVEKLGQDFLQNAPGWKKGSLEDGGFLYVLSPNLAGTGRNKFCENVKGYFGVDSVRRVAPHLNWEFTF